MFFRRTLRVFHFSMFSFLHVFVPSDLFIVNCICLLYCFFAVCYVLRFCVVTSSATDLKEHFLLSCVFYLTLLPNIWHNLLLSGLPWDWQFSLGSCRVSHWGSKHRPGPSVCLIHTVFGNYMISRKLYLNLSKYVDKLLLRKSFISFTNLILVHVILLIHFINVVLMHTVLLMLFY